DVRATLRLVDVTPAPEPPEHFEREMWARIEPQLRVAAPVRSWTARVAGLIPAAPAVWPRLAWGGGIAAAMVLAFFVGRIGRPGAPNTAQGRPAAFHA